MKTTLNLSSLSSLLLLASAASVSCEADDTPRGTSDEGGARGGTSGVSAGSGSGARPSSGGSSGEGGSRGGTAGKGAGKGGANQAAGAGGLPATGGSAAAGKGPTGGGAGRGGGSGEAGDGGGSGDGGDGTAGEGGGPGDARREFVYVSRLLGGVLSFEIERPSGVPRELERSPADSGRLHYGLAADPTKPFLYAFEPDPGHIDTYRIANDGTLPQDPNSSLAIDVQPITVTVRPNGQFLFVGTIEDQSIHVYAIDSDTGALTSAGEPFALGSTPAYVAVDPTGRFLYQSQALDTGIRAYRIEATGALSELDGSPFGETLVRAGAIVFAPNGAFLFSSGQGLNAFSIDETSGELLPVEGSPFSLDLGSDFFATDIAIDPQGEFLYTNAFTATRHVSGFRIDPETGALDEVPGSPLTTSSPYSIAVEPAGRFVLVGNDSGDISVFSLDRRNGAIDELDDSPFVPGGLQPGFAFATLR